MEPPVRDAQVPPPSPPPSAESLEELHFLLEQRNDELASYRWREAIWISIIFHVALFLSIIFAPKWWPGQATLLPLIQPQKDQTTYLQLPNDQTRVKPPRSDVISDKNRIAQSRTPVPDKELLRKILNAQRPGAPAPHPSAPAPAPQQQAAQQPAPPAPQQQAGEQSSQTPDQSQQTAALQTPPQSRANSPFKTAAPGAAVNQAIQSMAGSRGATHMTFSTSGDYGASRLQPRTDIRGDVEILSDTMGVDFGPYLQRVLYEIKTHWYNLVPEVARAPMMKKGKLAIDFSILKEGNVAGQTLRLSSGDLALDRAAWGGITDSNPLPPLPSQFKGTYLQLRIIFYYNTDPNEDRIK